MASIYRDSARDGWRVQIVVRGVRRKLWIGPVTKTAAKTIAGHLDRLKMAAETATPIPPDTLRWSRAVSARIKAQLAKWGLIELGAHSAELPRTLGDFATHYVDQLDAAESTKKRWRNVRRHLIGHWPEHTTLAAITAGECDQFAQSFRGTHAPSHAGKTIGDARQLFQSAVRHGLLLSNPFDGIDKAGGHDLEREHYISPQIADSLIENASSQYAALIALARYAGLRVPSEPLSLEWHHVNLAGGRLSVPARKTKARVIPMFPKLRPHLQALEDLAAPGQRFVFSAARKSAGTVWRSNLERILTRSGVDPWPKLWQNLRASCRTDLESQFPEFVVNDWMGHSTKVGRKHYTRVNASHFDLACGVTGGVTDPACGVTGGVPAPSAPDTTRHPHPTKNAGNQ